MVSGKNIRTEIPAGHSPAGSALNERPPLGFEQSLVGEPIRDGLLRDGGVPDLTHTTGESGLAAASDLNSPPQRGNVVFLHNHSLTRNLVRVNKTLCFTQDKEACIVLSMATAKKKPLSAGNHVTTTRRTEPSVGPDGFTMSQRVAQLMSEQGMSQSDLARACSSYYAAFMPGEAERVKQQHIFNIIQGQDSSFAVPLIAAVFDVNVMWLQYGIGKRENKPH